jgi:hypothetical protein
MNTSSWTMSLADLNEMRGFVYMYQEDNHAKVLIDTEHAREILERLITWENNQ